MFVKMQTRERAARAAFGLPGALALLVGSLNLLRYALGLPLYGIINPGAVAMAPSTALGFILLGAAAMTAAPATTRTRILTRLGALSAGALGALTLGEYVLGLGSGIDSLLCRAPGGAAGAVYPSRMAPDTAVCFVLAAAALWLKTAPRRSETESASAVILSLLAAAIGLSALIVTSVFGSIGWLGFTGMAVPTAALFAALGLTEAASLIARGALHWALDYRGTGAYLAGVVLVAAVGLCTSGGRGRVVELERHALHAERALHAASHLISAGGAAQACAHGYLASGDPRLRGACRDARAAYAEELVELRRLTGRDPRWGPRVAALETELSARLDWWNRAAAARRPGREPLEDIRAVASRDREFGTWIVARLAQVQAEEHESALGNQRELERLARASDSVAVAATVGGIAALIAGLFLLNGAVLRKKRDEEALRQSESRFRGLFESSRDALITLEYPSLRWSSANPAAVAMFRAKDEADLLARAFAESPVEGQSDGRRRRIEAAAREGPQNFEWTHRRLDGEEFAADVRLTRVESGGGAFLLATIRDLSEVNRTSAERRLLAAAIEQTSECVVITDAAARILYVNPAFENVTGYARAEAVGRTPALLKSGRHERSFYEELWATLARGETWRGRMFNRRKNGDIYEEESSIAPVRGEAGAVTHYIAVKRDVSKERALEAQFRHSQKMEAVGRLAGGIAHDFNNILTAIIGSAQLLGPAVAPASQAAEDVATIIESSLRAAALTRQMLAFSRRQAVENTTFDLNAAVGGIQRMLRRTLGEDVSLDVALQESPIWIRADAGQIDQVLLNLAVNARDAMPRGGTLAVSVSAAELTSARVSIHDSAPPGVYALVRCADTGEGMSVDVRSHLFEPFFTTKEKGKGTGLGLSTVYGIVKQCGGHVFVDSAPERGAVFELLFPLAAPPAARADGGAPGAAPAACSETILLVEDEETVLRMLQRTLKSQGYTVLPGRSAAEALEILAAHRGRVDLLLTDVVLAGMSGPDLARVVAAEHPGTKILYMSGYPEDRLADGEEASSALNFLQKPFQLSDLVVRVRRALDASAGPPAARQ